MAVIIEYAPGGNTFNLINLGAYTTQTALKLSGAPANTKYVFQIWDQSGTNKLVDVRQSQNQNGVAVFDLGEIMQNYVQTARGANTGSPFVTSSSDAPWGNLNYENARDEIYPYTIKVGSDDGATVTIDTEYSGYNVWNTTVSGDKNTTYFRGQAVGDPETAGCILSVRPLIRPLTDRPIVDLVDSSGNPTFAGGFPSNLTWSGQITYGYSIDAPAYEAYLKDGATKIDNRGFSLFWRNDYNIGPFANPYNTAIGAIRFDYYQGNVLLSSNVYPNITTNNGGPDTTPRQGNPAVHPYNVLGVNMGSISNDSYRTVTNTTIFSRPAGTTHFYVYPVATQPDVCASDFTGYSDYPSHMPVRVNIIEEYYTEHLPAGKGADLRGCTDYVPVQFRWTNRLGYQDHAWFMKKNTRTVNTKRQTYFKDNVNYGITGSNTDPEFIRNLGATIPYTDNDLQFNGLTSYNNTIDEVFTATTGYMHDEFAQYLQYMFQSPNVTANGKPIELLTTSWTEKNFAKDKLYQYEVRYRLATSNNVQND